MPASVVRLMEIRQLESGEAPRRFGEHQRPLLAAIRLPPKCSGGRVFRACIARLIPDGRSNAIHSRRPVKRDPATGVIYINLSVGRVNRRPTRLQLERHGTAPVPCLLKASVTNVVQTPKVNVDTALIHTTKSATPPSRTRFQSDRQSRGMIAGDPVLFDFGPTLQALGKRSLMWLVQSLAAVDDHRSGLLPGTNRRVFFRWLPRGSKGFAPRHGEMRFGVVKIRS